MNLKTKASPDWILWVDCMGGLIVGVLVLLLYPFLSRIEGLPKMVTFTLGLCNLIYGSASLFVTTRSPRPIQFVRLLALANMAWLLVCLGIVSVWFNSLTPIGFFLVTGEGIYVALLGVLEWTWRDKLASSPKGNR